ncbi:MAG: diaminopimelate epimerase [Kiritimatiellae bacterium]|nr:diaminopimelate epimerase [Kiritimatiellia bacterium]
MKIQFTKMHGAGNDFVMIDDRNEEIPWADHFLMAALAARRTGIGCEGIILLQKSDKADFRMRFLNPDGAEADMCGNGARCAAAFAREIGACGKALTMETRCGLVDAEIKDRGLVCVWLPEPTQRRYGIEISADGETVCGDFINTGVPHFVVPVENLSQVDVQRLGRKIRLHQEFAPEGTNVDFVSLRTPNRLSMRTYERGVEAESGACGTGAAACAVVAVEQHNFSLPAKIKTTTGYDLEIDGDWRRRKCTGLTLTGPVCLVYRGEIDLANADLGGAIID